MAMTKELRLTEIQGRGRSLVAAQPLKGGQIVLRDSPLLLYSALPLLTPSPPPYCDHCFKTLNPQNAAVSLCQSCSHHAFCSPNCLSAAQSSSHTPWVCHSLSKLRNCPSPLSGQSADLQVQARFLIAACNLAVVSPPSFQVLMSLQGEPQDSADARFLHSLVSTLCPPPPPPPPPQNPPFSVEITAALLAKDKQNAFGLMEPASELGLRSSRAYGIYPRASFFNHDCLPNACRFDYVDEGSTDITVRMIHDVLEGREICLSYFPVNQPYSSRQRTLAEDYGFVCQCDRCRVEANWSDKDEAEEAGGSGEGMDEDQDEEMEGDSESEGGGGSDIEVEAQGEEADFPHAYFFVRFMCSRTNCWGTQAPLPPKDDGTPSDAMECNVCGSVKKDEEISGHGQNGLSFDG